MVLPGHLSGGYLATLGLLAITHSAFSHSQLVSLYIIGTIAGEGPDIDLLFYYLQRRTNKNSDIESHRSYITHTPIFWIVFCGLISLVGLFLNSQFIEFIGYVILGGALSHLLFDSLEYGIRWMWPFVNMRFCVRNIDEQQIQGEKGTIPYYWTFITNVYITRWTFYAEIVVTIFTLWLAIY